MEHGRDEYGETSPEAPHSALPPPWAAVSGAWAQAAACVRWGKGKEGIPRDALEDLQGLLKQRTREEDAAGGDKASSWLIDCRAVGKVCARGAFPETWAPTWLAAHGRTHWIEQLALNCTLLLSGVAHSALTEGAHTVARSSRLQ